MRFFQINISFWLKQIYYYYYFLSLRITRFLIIIHLLAYLLIYLFHSIEIDRFVKKKNIALYNISIITNTRNID